MFHGVLSRSAGEPLAGPAWPKVGDAAPGECAKVHSSFEREPVREDIAALWDLIPERNRAVLAVQAGTERATGCKPWARLTDEERAVITLHAGQMGWEVLKLACAP